MKADEVKRINGAYARLFNTSDGKVVLESLENAYQNKMLTSGNDSTKTIVNAAKADVVTAIKQSMIAGGE